MTVVRNSEGGSYQALDPQAVLMQIAFGDIRNLLSTREGDYAEEVYTNTYISNLFKTVYDVADFLIEVVNEIRGYVETFDSVTPPPFDTYLQELAFLEKGGEITATANVSNELNVRDKPTTEGEKIGSIKANEEVKITGYSEDGKWAKVTREEEPEGYVSREYLDVDLENQDKKED